MSHAKATALACIVAAITLAAELSLASLIDLYGAIPHAIYAAFFYLALTYFKIGYSWLRYRDTNWFKILLPLAIFIIIRIEPTYYLNFECPNAGIGFTECLDTASARAAWFDNTGAAILIAAAIFLILRKIESQR